MAFVAKKPGAYRPRPQGQGTRPQGKTSSTGSTQSRAVYDRRPQMVYVNEQIKAPNIVIIDEEGNNLGTFPRRKALEIAEEKGLDIIQMRYDQQDMVSTVKMADYGKYMYQKQKDEKEKKKNQKPTTLKEMKLNYAIGLNDLNLKIKKGRELLTDGYNVKFMIKLKGREKIFAEKAIEKLNFVKSELANIGKSQYEHPKKEMYGYSIILFSK